MKHLIGKQVWLKPYGNTARYMKEEFIIDEVISAKVVNVELKNKGKFRLNEHHNNRYLEGTCNGGYLLFESVEDLNTHNKRLVLSKKLSKKFNYESDWSKIPSEKLFTVAEILGISPDGE